MRTKHLSYSNQEDESLATFMDRLSKEIKKLESTPGLQINDLIFNFPDKDTNNDILSVTIYYDSSAGKYAMEKYEFRAKASTPLEAYTKIHGEISSWIDSIGTIMLYDTKTEFLIDQSGDDVAKTTIYYEHEEPSKTVGTKRD